MAVTSITEKILNNNNLYTEKYYTDTIRLTKSIVLVNSTEAQMYNDYIELKYPTHKVDYSDKTSWRYYLHLAARRHELDPVVTLISLDNSQTVELTPEVIKHHRNTRLELLKFGLYYSDLVKSFPDQELYIKAVIANSKKDPVEYIIKKPDFTIVHFNDDLVEENEDDIVFHLQTRINNYKTTNLLPYYGLNDSLFIAAQYAILYNFILTSLLAIRLKNAKTLRAHSYHILNYLASNHYLDNYYQYLSKEQALFLYRNLLYLNNHSGSKKVFYTLIDKLFTPRNIAIVNYRYKQISELTDDNHTNYLFYQQKLNNIKLVTPKQKMDLYEVAGVTTPIAPGNAKTYKYHLPEINEKLYNTLQGSLYTKLMQTTVVDNTDSVKYKLIPMLIDYWAYLCSTDRMSYVVSVTDPTTNRLIKLQAVDLFKLFTILLNYSQGVFVTEFPDYTIRRVLKEDRPTFHKVHNKYLFRTKRAKDDLENLYSVLPYYHGITTSYMFYQFVDELYRLNIGMWLTETNLSDIYEAGQYQMAVKALHQSTTYSFNQETPTEFCIRTGLTDLDRLSTKTQSTFLFNILNTLFDNRLSYLNQYQLIQEALVEVFKQFNSYGTEMMASYTVTAPTLAGVEEPRYSMTKNEVFLEMPVEMYMIDYIIESKPKNSRLVETKLDTKNRWNVKSRFMIDLLSNLKTSNNTITRRKFELPVIDTSVVSSEISTPNPSSEDQLLFLAFNL